MPVCQKSECGSELHFNTKRMYCTDHIGEIRCAEQGCDKPIKHYKREGGSRQTYPFCATHQLRKESFGSASAPPRRQHWPAFDDPSGWLRWVKDRVRVDEHGCWVWNSDKCIASTGYISVGLPRGMPSNGHRLSWWASEWLKAGHQPEISGRQIDHQCHIVSTAPNPNKTCLNPDHLELRSPRENSSEAAYRKTRDVQVARLVHALRDVDPANPLLSEFSAWA